MVQAFKKITEKRLMWGGRVSRMKEGHIVRRMLHVDILGKRSRGRLNLRWKDAGKREMVEAGLKVDNATNRAEWLKKLISYTGDPDDGTRQGKDEVARACIINASIFFTTRLLCGQPITNRISCVIYPVYR